MREPVLLADVTRGPFVESLHVGHAVIARADGTIVESWGDPSVLVYPRSASKMIQALPLVEDDAGAHLSSEQLALACASHSAERHHIAAVSSWLDDLGLDESALACGPQASRDEALAEEMVRTGEPVTRLFNWCSGKHAGFLTLAKALGAGPDYVDPNHPVQRLVKDAFEDVTSETSPGFGIDGCSAPNYAVSLKGFAVALARFAAADNQESRRSRAMARLRDAMIAHPDLVAGKGRSDTRLMEATTEPVALKTGAEGIYVAILPNQKLGVALKVSDGATRASESAIAALMVRLGALDRNHPTAQHFLNTSLTNWDGQSIGAVRAAPGLLA